MVAAALLLAIGWQVARDIGRSVGPAMFRRMDPATAGTAGFFGGINDQCGFQTAPCSTHRTRTAFS